MTGNVWVLGNKSNMAVEEGEHDDKDGPKTGQDRTKLSHKKWRRLLQKEKRRVKRQQLAEQRKKLEEQEKWRLENDPIYKAKQEVKQRALEKKQQQQEEESKRQEKAWLEREAQAQIAFQKMKEREEKRERERLEQERKIKEEWEEEQRSKKEKEEKKKQEIQDKENAVFKELEKPSVEKNTSGEGQWHNPLAPPSNSQNYGSEQDTVNCSFYLKTGACRFGERCSRTHPRPPSSVTLLIPHMYQDIGLSQTMLDEADHDTGLEFDEDEAFERYKNFFEDVLPEFEKAGKVVQFKVCCNHEAHLRGNVYVQFSSEEECAQAFASFNGRWYAGKQLSCEYSPVTKWRHAICGFFVRNQCPRGKNCNFLHVYRNPNNAFRNMDRNDISPGRTPYSERGSERSTRDWRRESRDREDDVRERSYQGSERRRDRERNGDRDRRDRHSRDQDYEDRYRHRYNRDKERDDRKRYRDDRHRDRDDRERGRDKKNKDRERYDRYGYELERERDIDISNRGDFEHVDRDSKVTKLDRFGRDVELNRNIDTNKSQENASKRQYLDSNEGNGTLSNRSRNEHKKSRDNRSMSPDDDDGSSSSSEHNRGVDTDKRKFHKDVNEESGTDNEKGSMSSSNRKRKHHSSHKHHKKSKKKHKKHKHKRKRHSDSGEDDENITNNVEIENTAVKT